MKTKVEPCVNVEEIEYPCFMQRHDGLVVLAINSKVGVAIMEHDLVEGFFAFGFNQDCWKHFHGKITIEV